MNPQEGLKTPYTGVLNGIPHWPCPKYASGYFVSGSSRMRDLSLLTVVLGGGTDGGTFQMFSR